MNNNTNPSNQNVPKKRRATARTIRPLTADDTRGAPLIAANDAARLTGLGDTLVRRIFPLRRIGKPDYVRVVQVNAYINLGTLPVREDEQGKGNT